MDYNRLSTVLMFDSCGFTSCSSVNIVNDIYLENIESFFASLSRTTGLDVRISLDPVEAEIEIVDDDGAYLALSFPPLSSHISSVTS